MTRVVFKLGNILDEPADGLVSSGNVQLNMSGGVGGELLARGGGALQEALHGYLKNQLKSHVDPGFAMRIGSGATRFKSIVYAVSVDAWYDSNVDLVVRALSSALRLLAEDGCRTVAVPALATGYGNLQRREFGLALKRVVGQEDWPFSELLVVMRDKAALDEVEKAFNETGKSA